MLKESVFELIDNIFFFYLQYKMKFICVAKCVSILYKIIFFCERPFSRLYYSVQTTGNKGKMSNFDKNL